MAWRWRKSVVFHVINNCCRSSGGPGKQGRLIDGLVGGAGKDALGTRPGCWGPSRWHLTRAVWPRRGGNHVAVVVCNCSEGCSAAAAHRLTGECFQVVASWRRRANLRWYSPVDKSRRRGRRGRILGDLSLSMSARAQVMLSAAQYSPPCGSADHISIAKSASVPTLNKGEWHRQTRNANRNAYV